VRVVAHLRWEVEGDAEPRDPLGQQVPVARVRLARGAEAGVLAHGPEAAAVHGRLNAAGERELAGEAQLGFGIPAGQILWRACEIGGRGRLGRHRPRLYRDSDRGSGRGPGAAEQLTVNP